ncbi:hypothetical protein L6267_02790 [Candidatus Parcubacteria bacterium]|nr:hypothetical protein [Candidatus Parcubacteria bacterium]
MKISKVLSEIFRDIGQVFFASIFIGPIITGNADWIILSAGLLLSLLSWHISILLIKHI